MVRRKGSSSATIEIPRACTPPAAPFPGQLRWIPPPQQPPQIPIPYGPCVPSGSVPFVPTGYGPLPPPGYSPFPYPIRAPNTHHMPPGQGWPPFVQAQVPNRRDNSDRRRQHKRSVSPRLVRRKNGSKPGDKKKQRIDLDGHRGSSDSLQRRKKQEARRRYAEGHYTYTYRQYCAICGRSRSRRFQDQNPVKLGVIPTPGVCSRCRPSSPDIPPASPKVPPPPKPSTPLGIPRVPKGKREVEEVFVRRGPLQRSPPASQQDTTKGNRGSSSSSSPVPKRSKKQIKEQSSDSLDSWEKVKLVEKHRPSRNPPTKQDAWIPGPNARIKYRYRLADDGHFRRSDDTSNTEISPRQYVVRVRSRSEIDEFGTVDNKRPSASPAVRKQKLRPPKEDRADSPAEYYYRQFRRYVEPVYSSAPPQRRPSPSASPRLPVANSRAALPPVPRQQAILHAGPKPRAKSGQPYDGYRRPEYRSSDEDDVARRTRRVQFDNQRDEYGRGRTPISKRVEKRQEEAVKDWEEEQEDQRRYDKTKNRVRHRVHEGGGSIRN